MALRPPRAGFSVSRRLSERDRRARAGIPDSGADATTNGTPDSGVLGGMVEALQGLVEQLSRAASPAAAGLEPGAEPPPGGFHEIRLGKNGSAVFGYTLRMGLDGVAAEPFGDLPEKPRPRNAADAAKPVPAARQPIVDVFEEPGAIVVIAELPGADPANLVCRVEGQTLLIEANGARRYRKQVALPASVVGEPRHGFQNGILEVRLTPADAA